MNLQYKIDYEINGVCKIIYIYIFILINCISI